MLSNHAELFTPARDICLYKLAPHTFKPLDCIGNLLNPN